jgi:hypothetical protein
MKSFSNFQTEANKSLAGFHAKRLGLKYDKKTGGYVGRHTGEFVAKSVNGNLKFYNQNQQIGKKDPKQIRGNRFPNAVASDYKPNTPLRTEEQIKELREQYIAKEIFLEGDWIQNPMNGLVGKIIRRGTNYLICVTEENQMFKPWIHDVVEWTEISGVPADQRLIGTDSHRNYVAKMAGAEGIRNFINKYKAKRVNKK